MILKQLGVFGWKLEDENLVLASLLTGDPLLLIGNHGCAKTHLAGKIAQALNKKFLGYDASKAMFEDILGFPNIHKLQQGEVEYVPSPVTVWDKEILLIDEINRASEATVNKWLELIRSRKIMGFDTQVKWVWAAMNPVTYHGANALDAALIGRFALFLYPPDVLQMEEEDRIKVATHINGDDAPSLSEWTGGGNAGTVTHHEVESAGDSLNRILHNAGRHFLQLRTQLGTLAEFLAKFADLVARETAGEITLDGRRLGFIYRNLLANRAIELARADLLGETLPGFAESARYVVQASIPIAINEEGANREETLHKLEICFDLLSSYFEEDAELGRVDLIYELFTTKDLRRKAELLLTQPLGELALSKAWDDLLKEERDVTLLAYTAMQVDARRPGTVPQELLASLSGRIGTSRLTTAFIPALRGASVEYIDDVEEVLNQESDLARIVAHDHLSRALENGTVTKVRLAEVRRSIEADLAAFETLLRGQEKGGQAA